MHIGMRFCGEATGEATTILNASVWQQPRVLLIGQQPARHVGHRSITGRKRQLNSVRIAQWTTSLGTTNTTATYCLDPFDHSTSWLVAFGEWELPTNPLTLSFDELHHYVLYLIDKCVAR
jgi:hypothetical protein